MLQWNGKDLTSEDVYFMSESFSRAARSAREMARMLLRWLLLALPKGKAGGALPAAAGASVLALGAAFCLAGNNGLAALVSRAPYQDPDNSQQPVLALKQEYGLTDGSRPRDLMTREEGAIMARAAAKAR